VDNLKIALTSDFHLDFRQFNNQQRWRDFLDTFVKVTQRVKELKADAYVMAGDTFHKYRPHPGIIRRFLEEISTVDCPIILIRGNHDSPQLFFERYGGDTLHLIRDVSNIIYLNKKNPIHQVDDTCFIGLGYISFNVRQEISKHANRIESLSETKIGVFHQLLDYPGIPEDRAEVSRGFMKSLGLDLVLMGHYHIAYSEQGLFNSGSPEYWAFDQAEQIEVNLDTDEETVKPAKRHGFYLIEPMKGKGEFIEVDPARSMYCITYETDSFDEAIHLPKIRDHLEKYNIEGSMVKSIIKGSHRFGRLNLRSKLIIDKPLIYTNIMRLIPSEILPEKIDIIKAQTEYLAERGIEKITAQKIAEWLENNKERLANMQNSDILNMLREVLEEKGT
jgi:DNA repair exonuclease SbcCD nuclease subunit